MAQQMITGVKVTVNIDGWSSTLSMSVPTGRTLMATVRMAVDHATTQRTGQAGAFDINRLTSVAVVDANQTTVFGTGGQFSMSSISDMTLCNPREIVITVSTSAPVQQQTPVPQQPQVNYSSAAPQPNPTAPLDMQRRLGSARVLIHGGIALPSLPIAISASPLANTAFVQYPGLPGSALLPIRNGYLNGLQQPPIIARMGLPIFARPSPDTINMFQHSNLIDPRHGNVWTSNYSL